MREEQNYLREEVKRLKWQEGISYKYLAEELLDMKYNSFVNFVHGYKVNITLRQSRLSGVARATFPDKQSHLVINYCIMF